MTPLPGRPLDPSLKFCDLCGAAVWRVFLLEVGPKLMSPRLRAELHRRRAELHHRHGSPDWYVIISVPLCQPCAMLLDLKTEPAEPRNAAELAEALQSATPRPLDGTAQAAIATLLGRYEAEWL